MSGKSIIGNILGKFREPDDTSAEDIDKELKQSVEAIKAQKLDSVEGEKIVHSHDNKDFGLAYILDLQPIYALIGGSEGRMAECLRRDCSETFNEHTLSDQDNASIDGQFFAIRFHGTNEAEKFAQAAKIINIVGVKVLGSQFQELDISHCLIATKADKVFPKNGRMNVEHMKSAMKAGGSLLRMQKPAADAPAWLNLRWQKEANKAKLILQKRREKSAAPAPQAGQRKERVPRNTNRRKASKVFNGPEQRKNFDRRGRGY